MALSRDRVVDAALDLLQEDGLDRLSLRRLAERLGVSAPTLYWHVRDKRELLDLMAEEIIGRSGAAASAPLPGQDWEAWLRDRAAALRTALLGHRDSARVVAGNRPTVAALPLVEQQLEALAAAGFAPEDALLALLSISQYVTGHVLDEQLAAARDDERSEPLVEAFTSGRFPVIQQAAEAGVLHPDTRFEAGLSTILAGLRVRLEQRLAGVRQPT